MTTAARFEIDTLAPPASRAEALARARDLAPLIRERAAQAEADRRIPDATIDELLDLGLFHILTPKILGGTELGFASLVEITAELASACGSTGWVYGVLAGHSWMLHLFPEQAQRDVFADPNALTATVFRLGATVSPVDGGYRIQDGEGRFCSGIDFATWVIIGATVAGSTDEGDQRFLLVPRSEIVVEDDWFTAGMRGTGSRSIRIADAFVPAYRSCSLADMTQGAAPGTSLAQGPLYRFSFNEATPFSIAGAPLGMAQGAIKARTASLARDIAKQGDDGAGSNSAILELAGAATAIDIAYATVIADAEWVDSRNGTHDLSPLDRARIRRNRAYSVQQARRAVNRLFESAGGSSIYNSSKIQRFWRDLNSSAQHAAFGWDAGISGYGKALLGLKSGEYKIKARER